VKGNVPLVPRRLPLDRDELHLWCVSLDRPPSPLRSLEETLSQDERERALRFRFSRERRRYAAGRGLLRAVLASYLDVDPGTLTFSYTAYGKPSLTPLRESADLRFNLSRSQDWLLIGVARGRDIGVDVECLRPKSDLLTIARRFFAPAESAVLDSLPDAARTRAFFECWTRKEAFIKAVGEGLSIPLDSFEVAFGPGLEPALLRLRGSRQAADEWSIWGLAPAPGVSAAVAVKARGLSLRPWFWTERSEVVPWEATTDLD
jgi:4'-phosphopantetheinyl transferase